MDEWLLWPMFAYRWRTDEDRLHNSKWIVYENLGEMPAIRLFSRCHNSGRIGRSQAWTSFVGHLKFSMKACIAS